MKVKSIWKFPLEIISEQVIRVPEGAEALAVGVQPVIGHTHGPREQLVLWAMVEPSVKEKKEILMIWVYGTGHEIKEESFKRFIGTVQMNDGLVWHVFRGLQL